MKTKFLNFSEWDKSTKILCGIIALILLIIIFVTATALASGNFRPGKNYRTADPSPAKITGASSRLNAYNDLGQIRTSTKAVSSNSWGTIVIVSPWFSYEKNDAALFEELSKKENLLKSIISDYFKQYTLTQIKEKGELKVKEELLYLINDTLVLGKIRGLYFNDYMFIE